MLVFILWLKLTGNYFKKLNKNLKKLSNLFDKPDGKEFVCSKSIATQ